MSLNGNGDENLFAGEDFVLNEAQGVTCSNTLLYFLGGWMKHAIHLFPFYAPYVNSYKRYQTNSWAPTDLNQWAYDNRTVPFRVLGKD